MYIVAFFQILANMQPDNNDHNVSSSAGFPPFLPKTFWHFITIKLRLKQNQDENVKFKKPRT
jgi:hypothetical protein